MITVALAGCETEEQADRGASMLNLYKADVEQVCRWLDESCKFAHTLESDITNLTRSLSRFP